MVRFLILILVLSLPGCSTRSSETLVLDADSGIIDLAEQLPGEWQRVCILPPYSTNRTARELLVANRVRLLTCDTCERLWRRQRGSDGSRVDCD